MSWKKNVKITTEVETHQSVLEETEYQDRNYWMKNKRNDKLLEEIEELEDANKYYWHKKMI